MTEHIIVEKNLRPNDNTTILVYAMGKVGSRTVYESLRNSNLDFELYHVHDLTFHDMGYHKYLNKSTFKKIFNDAQKLKNDIVSEEKDWKIISIVRNDPIERNISSFFQNLHMFIPDYMERYKKSDLKLEELYVLFFKYVPHTLSLNWFDNQIKEVFGIDVFSEKFSKTKGYKIYVKKNYELLVIKLDQLSKKGSHIIGDFLDIDDFKIHDSNLAKDKDYFEIYQNFIENIKIPQEYINLMCESRFTRHFNSKKEIIRIRNRWENEKRR